jgi:hypothetical protein
MNSPDSSTEPEASENPAGEGNVRQKLAATARTAAAKVKATAGDAMAKARHEAGHLASEKKETAANRIGGYGSALHDSAQSLEDKDPNMAWFAHQAADKLQAAAEYVRTRDMAGLREDAASLARRHPVAFFGGMFAVGLIVGNLLKASPRKAARRPLAEPSFDETPADTAAQPDLSLTEGTAATNYGGL